MTLYPSPITEEYTFTDEKSVTVTREEMLLLATDEKEQLLIAWQRFMLSGFKKLFFTPALYRFLTGWKFPVQYNLDRFWHYYFNADVAHLKQFLTELTDPKPLGLTAPAADLKEAMCWEATRLYAPLTQILQDLEIKHEEMIAAWHDFAAAANITDATLPPAYLVSENTRNLLAYAAQIALTLGNQRPLTGLQMMFPLQPQPLLQPVLIESSEVVVLNSEGGVQ